VKAYMPLFGNILTGNDNLKLASVFIVRMALSFTIEL